MVQISTPIRDREYSKQIVLDLHHSALTPMVRFHFDRAFRDCVATRLGGDANGRQDGIPTARVQTLCQR